MRLTVFIVLLFSGVVQGQDLKNVQVLPYKNTRQHKFIARDMMSMVKQINEDFMTPMKVDAITCWTCHRGSTAPPHSIDDKPKPHEH